MVIKIFQLKKSFVHLAFSPKTKKKAIMLRSKIFAISLFSVVSQYKICHLMTHKEVRRQLLPSSSASQCLLG